MLLILVDDLGWNDVGYHGSEIETPSIDRLAREGSRLEHFYVSPICTPTRAALMTGRSPIHLGLNTVLLPWEHHGLSPAEYTLAERFRDAGYQTALIGKWHLGHRRSAYHPRMQGFDSFYGMLGGEVDFYAHTAEAVPGGPHYLDWLENDRPVEEAGYATTLLGRAAARYVRQAGGERPFLLMLAFNAPHKPKQAPAALVEAYLARGLLPERALHAAQVTALDRAIGGVLGALAQARQERNTLVLFLSDNGSNGDLGGSNEPFRGGKFSVYEGGVRAPAIARWPGVVPARRVCRQRMRDHDLFATLEAAARLPARAPAEGMNVWPMIRGAGEVEREPFFWSTQVLAHRAALEGRWKLVTRDEFLWLELPFGRFPVNVRRVELYDLESDPFERSDLADRHPSAVADLDAKLRAWEALYPEGGLRLRFPPSDFRPPRFSVLEMLEDPQVLAAHVARERRLAGCGVGALTHRARGAAACAVSALRDDRLRRPRRL